jgi:hypothetical protein
VGSGSRARAAGSHAVSLAAQAWSGERNSPEGRRFESDLGLQTAVQGTCTVILRPEAHEKP